METITENRTRVKEMVAGLEMFRRTPQAAAFANLMPKATRPMFYNLNSLANKSRRYLEDAAMRELGMSFTEVSKYDDEGLRWKLIERRHEFNGRIIERRKNGKKEV